ncbi:MAG: TetR/AcrR family transcriptional regulator, partial [Myxococcota bacterium]
MTKTPKGQRTRERIYAAASHIIAKEGFDGITMRAIAEQAGLSAGAAYHYVRGKDELVLGLYAHTQHQVGAHAAHLAEEGGNLTVRLTGMFSGGLKVLAPHRELLSHLATVVLAPGSPMSPFSASTHTIRSEAIANFRVVMGPHGDAQLAELCWMMWLGFILFWLNDRTPEQRATHAFIAKLVPIFVRVLPLARSTLF